MSFKPCKVTLGEAVLEGAAPHFVELLESLAKRASTLGLLAVKTGRTLRVKENNDLDTLNYEELIGMTELSERLDQYEAEQRRATERLQASAQPDPMSRQVGGNHYAKLAIQPTEYTVRNGLGFLEGNVVKYVTRHSDKGGVKDIDKAIHYLEMIKHYQYGGEK